MRKISFISNSKRVLTLIAVLGGIIGGLFFLNRGLMLQDSNELVGPFLEKEQSFDVLMFGSSHTMCSIYPAQLWEDYGIRAYNLGGHGQSMAASYWTMRMAVAEHKPKIAVLDVYKTFDMDTKTNIYYAHTSFDAYPLSLSKWMAVREIYPGDLESQAELLFPLRLYHSRWDEWDSGMSYAAIGRTGEPSPQLGADAQFTLTAYPEMELDPRENRTPPETVGAAYAMAFVHECLENDILPVLINLPYQATTEYQREVNSLLAEAKRAGAKTINFQYLGLLDRDTDWADKTDHVNLSGGRKLTAYLGQYLQELLGTEPGQPDPLWNNRSQAYRVYIGEILRSAQNRKEALLALYNSGFSAELAVPKGTELDSVTQKLVAQLGDTLTYIETDTPDRCLLRVYDPEGELYLEKNFYWKA